jgi:D-alanyl-lipoteichoic acid acyltransferase DltB (MBOAT superfamily)
MPFQSLDFLYFFAVFYIAYLALHKWHRLQNIWLLLGSYFYYATWDWHFLIVILGLTGINYLVGRGIDREWGRNSSSVTIKRLLLAAGLFSNLGCLAYFKYMDFFNRGILRFFESSGIPVDNLLVNVIAPIGISFYILQICSYLIDIYNKRIPASSSLLDVALFIAFFPQVLSGPIERAARMLPQFKRTRHLTADQVSAGIYLLLSGFFKKMVVADNLALIANQVFDNYHNYSGLDIGIGVLAFTGQLYADFSAYSDIARGLARLMGFELIVNFRLPYFSASPAEFWQRWHISLSEWLRDYIFFPLRKALLRWKFPASQIIALFAPPLITMLVSGLWHGTGWNFIVWGLFHGCLLIVYQVLPSRLSLQQGSSPNSMSALGLARLRSYIFPLASTGVRILMMFLLTCFGWLIFRSQTLEQAATMLSNFSFTPSTQTLGLWADLMIYSLPVAVTQLLQQWRGDLLLLARLPAIPRLVLYATALALIVILGVRETNEFIYVQF